MQNVRFSALGVILGSLFVVALVVITDVPKPMTFTLLALMVAGVGMIEQWAGLRRRFAGPGNEEEMD